MLEDIFPRAIRMRFGVPEGTRVMTIDGQPPGGLTTLTEPFEAADRESWTVKFHVIEPDGNSRDLELPMTAEDPHLPPDPTMPPPDIDRAQPPPAPID